jgi:hypothetical protein
MKLQELKERLEGKIQGYTPLIVTLEEIDTGKEFKKFIMKEKGRLRQVFGVTQEVLDNIDLTDDELVHYVTEWTRACAKTIHSSNQTIKEDEK